MVMAYHEDRPLTCHAQRRQPLALSRAKGKHLRGPDRPPGHPGCFAALSMTWRWWSC